MTPAKIIPPEEEMLKSDKFFAIVSASNEMVKYGHEFVSSFKDYEIKIFSINPRYEDIEGVKCYPSLK